MQYDGDKHMRSYACICGLLPCKVEMLAQCDVMSVKEKGYEVHKAPITFPLICCRKSMTNQPCVTLPACSHVDKLATFIRSLSLAFQWQE